MFKIKKIILFAVSIAVFFMPFLVYAVEPYVPIEEIPLVGKQTEITNYLKGIFQFGVAAIAIVSMLAIMIGGYLYIFSGGSKGVEKAKTMIVNALLGLGLALVSWIIVYTINPDLIELKGIRSVNINIVGMVGPGNVSPGVGVNISDLCFIQEVKWEATSAFLGNPATLVFNLPKDCVENKDIKGFSVDVTIQAYGLRRGGFGTIDLVNLNLNKNKGQLVSDTQYPFMLKAQWSIPASGEALEGDRLSFTAQSNFVMKDNSNFRSETKKSSNELEILPTRLISTCEISGARWADGARFNKNASGTLESVEATLNVTVSPGCNTDVIIAKYALMPKLYIGSVESHRPETLIFNPRIINFPDPSGNVIRVSYNINARNLSDIRYRAGDWFYVKTVIVNAQDTSQQIFPSRTTVDSGNISEAHPQEI